MIGELTNHLWQSTLFAVAAGLLTVVFRKNRAKIRYWLWLSASLKFLLPFSLLISLGSHLAWAPAVKRIAPQAVSFTMVQITQPFHNVSSLKHSAPHTVNFPTAIAGFWACGFGLIVLTRLKVWLRMRSTVRLSNPLEIRATVEVRSSPGLLEPGVVGLFRPVLLLPEGIIERLTSPQLEAVISHEMCHIRRLDNLTAAIHMIVEALFWFHPLVWWIGASLVKERERACDEEVLRLGTEPHAYAEGILRVCKLYVESPLPCVAGITGRNLKRRVELIMRNQIGDPVDSSRKLLLTMLGVAVLTVPIVTGLLGATPRVSQSHPEDAGAASTVFQSASIRPHNSSDRMQGHQIQYTRTGFTARNITLQKLIQDSCQVQAIQISGAPDWVNAETYDIEATMEKSVADELQKLDALQSLPKRQGMLLALLEDRFQLSFHRETQEVPVYALVIAKNGPRLQVPKPGDTYPGGIKDPSGRGHAGLVLMEAGKLTGQGVPVSELIGMLSRQNLGRTIVDKTGLTGDYDFILQWIPDKGSNVPDTGIFTAIREQLGLELKSQDEPQEILIIDHVEKPADN